jgi:hypothetical protein
LISEASEFTTKELHSLIRMAQIQSLYLGKAGNYSGEMRDTQQESK